jgi:hypothetical protein
MCAQPPRPVARGDHLGRVFYWDYERGTIPYDVAVAAKKILDAGLPASLAERLSLGF